MGTLFSTQHAQPDPCCRHLPGITCHVTHVKTRPFHRESQTRPSSLHSPVELLDGECDSPARRQLHPQVEAPVDQLGQVLALLLPEEHRHHRVACNTKRGSVTESIKRIMEKYKIRFNSNKKQRNYLTKSFNAHGFNQHGPVFHTELTQHGTARPGSGSAEHGTAAHGTA